MKNISQGENHNQQQSLGRRGEDVAGDYLVRQGYVILERHWCMHWGEIDLITRYGDEVVFIEVKTRRGGRFGRAIEAMSAGKCNRLRRSVYFYLQTHGWSDQKFRIDLIAIDVDDDRRQYHVQHVRSVVEG